MLGMGGSSSKHGAYYAEPIPPGYFPFAGAVYYHPPYMGPIKGCDLFGRKRRKREKALREFWYTTPTIWQYPPQLYSPQQLQAFNVYPQPQPQPPVPMPEPVAQSMPMPTPEPLIPVPGSPQYPISMPTPMRMAAAEAPIHISESPERPNDFPYPPFNAPTGPVIPDFAEGDTRRRQRARRRGSHRSRHRHPRLSSSNSSSSSSSDSSDSDSDTSSTPPPRSHPPHFPQPSSPRSWFTPTPPPPPMPPSSSSSSPSSPSSSSSPLASGHRRGYNQFYQDRSHNPHNPLPPPPRDVLDSAPYRRILAELSSMRGRNW